MSINTIYGPEIETVMLENYLSRMVNKIFKILPMKEKNEPTLQKYIESVLIELIGCKSLIVQIQNDSMFISLIATLQYFADNINAPKETFRSEIFKLISTCKKLSEKYSEAAGG